MADEALSKAGLYFDELNKIRVLEPEVANQTGELKDECKEFVDSELERCFLCKIYIKQMSFQKFENFGKGQTILLKWLMVFLKPLNQKK